MRLAATSVALATAIAASSARADDVDRSRVYDLDPAIDLPLLGLGLAATSAGLLEVPPSPCLPDCEVPVGMPGFDRAAIGRHSPASHAAADALVFTLVLGPPVWSAVDAGTADGWFADTVVHTESLLLTQGLTQIVKFAVRRPAPIVYDDRVPLSERESRDASRSFWSGHTATAFSTATTHAVTYWLRHPKDPWRFVVVAADMTAAAAVGLLKIDAGYHYASDVAAGAVVGASIGVLVPMLHHRF